MASKFEGVLNRKTPAQSEPSETSSTQTPAPTAAKPAAPKPPATPAKKLAKTKDPDWKGYTLILKIDTHTDASAILRKQRTGEDMSDLAQRLFEEWIAKNR
jgi:hypothetical protein